MPSLSVRLPTYVVVVVVVVVVVGEVAQQVRKRANTGCNQTTFILLLY